MNDKNLKEAAEKPEEKKEDAKQELSEVEKLKQDFAKCQAEKDDIFGRLQRVSAEFANFQKRSVRHIAETIAYEKENIIKSLLPILDNFEHTLAHVEKTPEAAEVQKGVRIIYDQFISVLKIFGVEQIKAVGEKFDPACHQALTQRSEADKDDQIVLEEFRKGYKLGEKILRPAIVIVNKKAPAPEQPKDDAEEVPPGGSENGD